jgi:hypothetical protein
MTTNSTDSISDGYHTFGEIYRHRNALFVALMKAHPELSWYSALHNDGTMYNCMIIAGMDLPTGQVTYHMNDIPWFDTIRALGIRYLERAPKYDGHTPDDVIDRLLLFASRDDQ